MSNFEQAVGILTKGSRHRVWSLIVTIFGDLARNSGDEISARTLGKLTEPIGVKSEALRVGLHRLRKEGWLDSKRVGRGSSYYLAEYGRRQTAAATPRIYAQTNPEIDGWFLFMASSSTEERLQDLSGHQDLIRLNSQAFIGRKKDGLSSGLLTARVDLDHVPEWVKEQALDREICTNYSDLKATFKDTEAALLSDQGTLEKAILRTLIVHSWRRVLLRHADLPEQFHPKKCEASACKSVYLGLLDKLPRPTLQELADT